MIIHAGAKYVFLERHIVGRQSRTTGAVEMAETDVKVFRLGGPIAGQGEFDTAAGGPSGIGGVTAGKARR